MCCKTNSYAKIGQFSFTRERTICTICFYFETTDPALWQFFWFKLIWKWFFNIETGSYLYVSFTYFFISLVTFRFSNGLMLQTVFRNGCCFIFYDFLKSATYLCFLATTGSYSLTSLVFQTGVKYDNKHLIFMKIWNPNLLIGLFGLFTYFFPKNSNFLTSLVIETAPRWGNLLIFIDFFFNLSRIMELWNICLSFRTKSLNFN